ncbi:MAG: LTA synthase family protein [Parabacteroides sp.]
MMSKARQSGLRIFKQADSLYALGGILFLKIQLFNITWCAYTTFTPFSHPELYLSSICLTCLLLMPTLLTHSRWVGLLTLCLLDSWLVANLMYYRTYFTAIPPSSYVIMGNLKDFTQSIYSSFRSYDLLFPLTTGIALFFPWRHPSAQLRHCLTLLAGSLLLLVLLLHSDGGFRLRYKALRSSAYLYASGTPMFTLLGTLYYEWGETHAATQPGDRTEITESLSQLPALLPLPSSMPHRQQCVIILVESLESWVLEQQVEEQEITPCLNRLLQAPNTLYAPHVLTQVNGGRSIDAQLLILAGLLPISSGTYSSLYPHHTYPSLVKAMQTQYGTHSYLLTSDRATTWNQRAVAQSFGIDTLLTNTDFTPSAEAFGSRKRLGDHPFVEQCIEKMKRGEIWPAGEKAFTLFITYSSHFPFQMPEELKSVRFSTAIPSMMSDYLSVAHYTDAAIGQLVDYLRSRPDFAETLVVITGDHEGLASHRNTLLTTKAGQQFISPKPFTPFILLNAPFALRYEPVMGQIDIYPTLLQLLGLTDYHWHGLGQSILDPFKPASAVNPQMQAEGDTLVERLQAAYPLSDHIIRSDYFRESHSKP